MLQSSDGAELNMRVTNLIRIMCYGRGWELKMKKIEGTTLAHNITIMRSKQEEGAT